MEEEKEILGGSTEDMREAGAAGKQYKGMTRKKLYEEVKSRGYKGTSKYKKAQLLELLISGAPVPASPKKRPTSRKKASAQAPAAGETAEVIEKPQVPEEPAADTGDLREPTDKPETPSAPGEPKDVYVDWGYPLPERYGLDRIGAMAKDPNWIFVYWDMSGSRRQEVAQSHGHEIFSVSRWHLRIVDLASKECVDFPVNIDSANWYVPVPEDKVFKVQIGMITPDGVFIEFATTREIRTPRSRPSDNISEQWMVADEQFQRFLRQAGGPGASELSSKNLASHLRDRLSK